MYECATWDAGAVRLADMQGTDRGSGVCVVGQELVQVHCRTSKPGAASEPVVRVDVLVSMFRHEQVGLAALCGSERDRICKGDAMVVRPGVVRGRTGVKWARCGWWTREDDDSEQARSGQREGSKRAGGES